MPQTNLPEKKAVDIKGVKPAANIVIVNRNEFRIEELQREIDSRRDGTSAS